MTAWGAMTVMVLGLTAADQPKELTAHERIRRHRTAILRIRTRPGATVSVQQQRHAFWFGTAISNRAFNGQMAPQDRKRYLEILRTHFNAGVTENALKWKQIERKPGEIDYTTADRIAAWCAEHAMPLRGHCVFWCVDRYVQDWVQALDDGALRQAVRKRATGLVTRYRGRIPEYDVNNEMIHGNFYARRPGPEIRHQMFRWCRDADPEAVLYVNDFNILTGRQLDRYEALIEGLLKAGVPLGGIGVQGHFGRTLDVATIRRVLDRLARFGLPIRVTEFDMNTDDEQAKAQGLVDLYTTCFAHPAVTGILMWGFWEKAHWRPKAALWNADWKPTPAAEAYRDLVYRQWWTTFSGEADEDGLCEVRVYLGQHRVTADGVERVVDIAEAGQAREVFVIRDSGSDAATQPKSSVPEDTDQEPDPSRTPSRLKPQSKETLP